MHLVMVFVYMQLIIKGGFTKTFCTLDPQHQQRNHVLNLEKLIELRQNSVRRSMDGIDLIQVIESTFKASERRTQVIGELTIPKMPVTIAPIRTEK